MFNPYAFSNRTSAQEPLIVIMGTPRSAPMNSIFMRWSMGPLLNHWFSQQQVGWLTKELFYYKHLASLLSEKRNGHYDVVTDVVHLFLFCDHQSNDVYMVLAFRLVDLPVRTQ